MSEFSDKEWVRIRKKWESPQAFYSERDDRTTRIVTDLSTHAYSPVEIHVDPAMAHDVTVQRTVLVACNLTSRWARGIHVVLKDNIQLAQLLKRDGLSSLDARIRREMAFADPFGSFSVGPTSVSRGDGPRPLRLFVGPWDSTDLFSGEDYQVHAAGWTAFAHRGARGNDHVPTEPATVAAAGLAASLGAADLFKRAIGHPKSEWMPTLAWDTWSSDLRRGLDAWSTAVVRSSNPSLDLRRTLLAGVGAIGSAFVYLLDLMRTQGELTLFDRDAVEITNLNRSPMFTVLDALYSPMKTAAAKTYLKGRNLRVTTRDGVWREHTASIAEERFDVWISLTNEDGAWAELPFQLPPVVLHGTTTSGWGFGAGRHIPRLEDCTLCRMPRPTAQFRGPCAEGVIAAVANGEEIRASLPFLSTAAASLLLAMFTQLNEGSEALALPNHVSADLSVGLPALVALSRGTVDECRGCRAMRSPAWELRGGIGHFARYSVLGSSL